MTKSYVGFIAGLLCLAGCSNNDFTDNGGIIPDGQKKTISSITAVMDEADTRTQLVEGHKVVWDKGDYLMVYSDLDEWDGRRYDLVSGAGTSTGSFEGDEMPGTVFYAFTGGGSTFSYDRENQEISFYWAQEMIVGGEPSSIERNIPMFAVSTGSEMTFKQLTGIMHFQVKGSGSLVSAEIYDNGGKQIPESYTIGFKSEDITLKPFLGNGDEPVYYDSFGGSVKTAEGYVALSETEPVDIYFVLPSCIEYESGFTLRLGIGDENGANVELVEKSYNSSFTVERGFVANFPAFNANTGGEVSAVGWKSNFCNLSGKKVGVSYYYSNDKSQVFWDIVFLTENDPNGLNDPIYVTIVKDNTGTAPSLTDLNGAKIIDVKMHDSATGHIYRTNSDVTLAVSQATDGSWSMSITDMTIYENNGAASDQTGIYVKYNGGVNVEPPPTWTFTGAANMSGAYAVLQPDYEKAGTFSQMGGTHERDFVRWRLRFTNFPWGDGSYIPGDFKEVVIIWEEEHDGVLPSFPTNTEITDFWLDIMPNGYDFSSTYRMVDNESVLKIYLNDDGTYEINVPTMKMYHEGNMSADPIVSSFSFNGELDKGALETGYGSLGFDGEFVTYNSHCTYSEDGWHLYFNNFTTDSNNELGKYVKDMVIVLDADLDDGVRCPEFNGSNIIVQISSPTFGVTFTNKDSLLRLNYNDDGTCVIKLDGKLVSTKDGSEYNFGFEWSGYLPKVNE